MANKRIRDPRGSLASNHYIRSGAISDDARGAVQQGSGTKREAREDGAGRLPRSPGAGEKALGPVQATAYRLRAHRIRRRQQLEHQALRRLLRLRIKSRGRGRGPGGTSPGDRVRPDAEGYGRVNAGELG